MAIHIEITAPSESSGAKSNAHFTIEVISSEQLLQNNRDTLIPLPDAVGCNQNLPAFVNDYCANCHEIREFFAALEERLRAGRKHQSLIHHANSSSRGVKDVLNPEMLELARASEKQSRMRAMLRSIDDGLDVKLDRVNAWKKVSAIFFTLVAATSAVAAVTAVNVNPKRIAAAAAATAATVLISALGKAIHSLLTKRESTVKKNRDIIRAMLIGAEIIIKDLTELYDLACDLQSQTACILEMIDDGATDVAVREKVSALNNSFRKLQRKARSCSLDVSSATDAVLQSIIRNAD